ncbi:MAG: hypothetical protein U0176_25925 [Bacteroidia bacterium]
MKNPKNFAEWADWFRDFQGRQLPVDWNSMTREPEEAKETVARSVRQFQLGESSEATQLKSKVAKLVKRGGDRHYADAIEWFIFEENRHARLLGRFMAIEDMPKAKKLFADSTFRFLRHMGGLLNQLLILSAAEMIAVPYYSALRRSTDSPILTAICNQILLDEAMHLRFQGQSILMLTNKRSPLRLKWLRWRHKVLLELAVDVVWFGHAELFRIGGYDFKTFRLESIEQFELLWRTILKRDAPAEQPATDPSAIPNTLSLNP